MTHRTAERAVRVLIADDQPLLTSALATIIGSAPDIEVVATATDGHAAVKAVESHVVDVALVDIRMPLMDGVAATRWITRRSSAPRVLILTTFNEDHLVRRAVEAGASGFLLKDADPEELITAVREVAAGGFVIASAAGGHLARAYRELAGTRKHAAVDRAVLTPREAQVFEHVALGMTNAEIARELTVSEETVKTHVSHLLAKLQCRDRIGLVVLAHAAPE